MKKPKPTIEMRLVEYEEYFRKQAERILQSKENGVSQKSIDKMISWMSISKKYYDDLKRRYEENGK